MIEDIRPLKAKNSLEQESAQIITMHIGENLKKECEEEELYVVVVGHDCSDSIGWISSSTNFKRRAKVICLFWIYKISKTIMDALSRGLLVFPIC
ncbi:MAG: hypothetical protein ACFFCT_00660 [Candidatus Odinarchaeota archaeon]